MSSTSTRVPNSVVVGATAVGIGVVVGAGIAYVSSRLMYSSRVAQDISLLHDNIVEMKENLHAIEQELGKICNRNGSTPASIIHSRSSTTSLRKSKPRKNVSFSSSVSETSFVTAAAAPDSFSDGRTDASQESYETDYFSPDEDDEEFYDFYPSDAEEISKFPSTNDISNSWFESSELTKLLGKVDSQFVSGVEEDIYAAHEALLNAEKKYQDNSEVLWRLAKSFRNLSTLEDKKGNIQQKKAFIFEAFKFAERSLSVNDSSADTHKWFAIISGARGEYLGTKERIASGRVFKKHIDTALTISPNDATLHHLLGRFCYEIAGLSWLERKAAAALFGAVPDGSYGEALEHFQAAEKLHPSGWKENRLFIAKCSIQLNQLEEVPSWIAKGLQLPTNTADDMLVDVQLKELQNKYGSL